jgi:hypothetical protein
MKSSLFWSLLLSLTLAQGLMAQAKVKSLDFKDFVLDEASDEGAMKMVKRELKEFDANGRMTKFITYAQSPAGEVIKATEANRSYGADGRMEENIQYDEQGKEKSKERLYFNTEDKKVKHEFVDPKRGKEGELFRKEYTYTDFKKPKGIVFFDPTGKKIGEETWKYNKDEEEIEYNKWETMPNGKKYEETKKTSYNKDGNLAGSEKIIKDDKGDEYKEVVVFERNRVKEQFKYKNGQVVSQFGGVKSNDNPQKGKVMMDFGNGEEDMMYGAWATEDEFDDKGNKVKTVQTVDGVVTQETSYQYDNRNNLVKSIKVSFQDGVETGKEEEVMEYDDKNNLKRKAIYTNGFLMSEKIYDYKYHP